MGPVAVAYAPSKSFLNPVTVQYAKELEDTNVLINAACPGFVATGLNGFRGTRPPRAGRGNPDPGWRPCPTTVRPEGSSTTREPCPGDPRGREPTDSVIAPGQLERPAAVRTP